MKRFIPILLSVLILILSILAAANMHKDEAVRRLFEKTENIGKSVEMRGVWVTYMTLDVENETDKETAFRKKIKTIVSEITESGFNTMVVQARPFCDAIYPSKYFPWSHIITGEQGKDPGFDPMQIIVDECRANGVSVHAWINPYRIATAQTPYNLCSTHPYVSDPTLGVVVNGETYLNPASEKARRLIVSGVAELAQNYDIDAIHFDDYFYPENCGDFDKADYEAYQKTNASPLSLDEFRKENVTELIRSVYSAVKKVNEHIQFGVSPQGNLENNQVLYADVEKWCAEKGYIDYICPQIYFSPDNPAMTFENCLNDWLKISKHKDLRLYVGIAAYKAGTDADEGTWLDNDDILKTEVEILRKEKIKGFIMFSYDSFHDSDNKNEVQNLVYYLVNSPTQ